MILKWYKIDFGSNNQQVSNAFIHSFVHLFIFYFLDSSMVVLSYARLSEETGFESIN